MNRDVIPGLVGSVSGLVLENATRNCTKDTVISRRRCNMHVAHRIAITAPHAAGGGSTGAT